MRELARLVFHGEGPHVGQVISDPEAAGHEPAGVETVSEVVFAIWETHGPLGVCLAIGVLRRACLVSPLPARPLVGVVVAVLQVLAFPAGHFALCQVEAPRLGGSRSELVAQRLARSLP